MNFNIHACVAYASCKVEWWNEITKQLSFPSKSLQVVSFQSMFPSGIELTMVLRMVYWCAPIGITLLRSIFYTLASFGRYCLLYFLSKHMCKLQSKLLAHMKGSNCYHLRFMKLVHILFHMVKMLRQATIQMNFNSYLFEKVVINYQKGGDWKL